MEIKIREVFQAEPQHFRLLLDADPSRELVEGYLSRGKIFEAVSEKVDREKSLGVIVLLPTRPEMLEIVNIAVDPSYRGRGIATQMIAFSLSFAKEQGYHTMEIGTGSTGFEQLYLYQKCGFRMIAIDRDFFTRNYDEEIIENNFILRDMVRLSQDL